MTRNRAAKQSIRRTAAAQSVRYTEAHWQMQEPPLEADDDRTGYDEFQEACCSVLEDMERGLRELFDRDNVDALVAELDRLAQGALGRDSHYGYGSNHDVMLTVDSVCGPLLYQHGVKTSGEPIVWNEPMLRGAKHARVRDAYRALEAAVSRAQKANWPY